MVRFLSLPYQIKRSSQLRFVFAFVCTGATTPKDKNQHNGERTRLDKLASTATFASACGIAAYFGIKYISQHYNINLISSTSKSYAKAEASAMSLNELRGIASKLCICRDSKLRNSGMYLSKVWESYLTMLGSQTDNVNNNNNGNESNETQIQIQIPFGLSSFCIYSNNFAQIVLIIMLESLLQKKNKNRNDALSLKFEEKMQFCQKMIKKNYCLYMIKLI